MISKRTIKLSTQPTRLMERLLLRWTPSPFLIVERGGVYGGGMHSWLLANNTCHAPTGRCIGLNIGGVSLPSQIIWAMSD